MKPHPDDERREHWLPTSAAKQVDGLGLFDNVGSSPDVPANVNTPSMLPIANIRVPAPSSPGSETSREAAALVSVDGEALRCLLWFAKQSGPRTRQQLAMEVYPAKREGDVPGLGPACGRVNLLVTLGYLAEVGRERRRATLAISDAGRRWLAKRRAA